MTAGATKSRIRSKIGLALVATERPREVVFSIADRPALLVIGIEEFGARAVGDGDQNAVILPHEGSISAFDVEVAR